MEVFEIIHAGPLTTIQDLGRYGCQQYGIPPSGAMDDYALRVANLIVGNDENSAGLEITLLGLKLRVLTGTVIGVTGADLAITINGNPVSQWQAIAVHNGDIISFPRLRSGCRAYLAVGGGLDTPRVMGSAATYSRAKIGGLEGGPLRDGDHIRCGIPNLSLVGTRVPCQYIPAYSYQIGLRVILGPQDDHFIEQSIYTLLHAVYTISNMADRTGYRLEGPPIQHNDGADIISDGIPLGAIQVPGDGLPIILLVDRPTTGGYAKIATVISCDIPKLAQAKPGDKVRFTQVSEQQAHKARREYDRKIQTLKAYLTEVR